MTIVPRPAQDALCWLQIGDLHLTAADTDHYRDLLRILRLLAGLPPGAVDFVLLPGDVADNGTPAQYRLLTEALAGFPHPVHAVPGDHDMAPGDLRAFNAVLAPRGLPRAEEAGSCRCLFLDVVSAGTGGPDFRMDDAQLDWLEREAAAAGTAGQTVAVFMHTYPADLRAGRDRVNRVLALPHVRTVAMGHTHYNELANDGSTVFMATRSTGQVEEGPVGVSVAALDGGGVSWRFKPLDQLFPFVLVTAPVDHRLATAPGPGVAGPGAVHARVLSDRPVRSVCCRADDGAWQAMAPVPGVPGSWQGTFPGPARQVEVEALDAYGRRDRDRVEPSPPGWTRPGTVADGSDAARLPAWEERGLLDTQLGPNRNGKQW